MKKLFFVMAAAAALLTSCSKDDTFGGPTRGKVTFEVSTPELATRYGEGTTATTLQYAVYDMVEDATNGKLVDTGTATLSNKTATVSIDLVEGRKYTAIFWADAGENASPYTFTPATKTVSYTNVNALEANQEAYDAFYAFVPQADIKVGQTVNVTLKRPFAQLRIETSDTDRAKQLGVEVVKTGITVNAYTSFNLETGAVDGQQNITFKPTNKASAPRATVGGADYDLISMNYILANTRETVDVTLNFTDDVNGTEESYVRKYSSVNVERNHRTLVRGTILTDPTEFDVTVSEGFDGDINEDRDTSETLVVSDADDIREAFENLNDNDPSNDPGTIVLGNDIDLSGGDWTSIFGYDNSASLSTMTRAGEEQDPSITIKKNQELTLDLNGFTLSAISKQTDKNGDGQTNANDNVNLINVLGTLTVQNGTITTKHEGANMEWNASTNVFNVTDGGVLNLSNVIAKNLGGSDMAFVAHLNNWGEVTLNVENSTLESTYIAVRVFNSGNDMNNVTIKNSTLKGGSRAFWVHNYTLADFGNNADKTAAHQALLNFTIFNNAEQNCNNTFIADNEYRIIEYGFTDAINLDEMGNIYVAEGVGKEMDAEVYHIYNAVGLKNALTAAGAAGAGNTELVIDSDIDMSNVEWTPINVDGYHGADIVTLDGNYKTLTGMKAALFDGGFAGGSGIVIKNLTIEDANMTATNSTGYGAFVCAADSMDKITLENCHLINSSITGTNDSRIGGLVGWTSGYSNQDDGPVKTYVTIKDCSVIGCTLNGANSIGAINGHAGASDWTYTTIENCVVKNNTLTSTDDGDWRVGVVVGTANSGEVIIKNITESGNTLSQGDKTAPEGEKRNYYGRFVPNSTGLLIIDGVATVSSTSTLATALGKGITDINLTKGTYSLPAAIQGKTVTIVGNEETIIKVNKDGTDSQNTSNATIHFEGVKIEGAMDNYRGFPHTKEVSFKNCTIENLVFLHSKATFEGCTFESTAEHCVWTYGAKDVTFTDCTFNYGDRCVNVYVDNGTESVKVDFTNCTFVNTDDDTKGAVEINSSVFPMGANVSLTNCTAPSKGDMVYISEWDSTAGATATVTINGETYNTPVHQSN